MRTYLLIGGIGSGKSSVAGMLAAMGARCIDLDLIGHDVLTQEDIVGSLVAAFGEGVLAPDGRIDRKALARAAFATPADTEKLNGIMQPRIVDAALVRLRQLEAEGCSVAVVEISPFDGPNGRFARIVDVANGIIAVVAPDDVRVAHAVVRGFSEADVRNRMARQVSDGTRRQWARFVVENVGTMEDLRHQVEGVWRNLKSNGGR